MFRSILKCVLNFMVAIPLLVELDTQYCNCETDDAIPISFLLSFQASGKHKDAVATNSIISSFVLVSLVLKV